VDVWDVATATPHAVRVPPRVTPEQVGASRLEHLKGFGEKFAERFLALVTSTRFIVYGAPSDEAKQGLSGLGPTCFGPCGGFVR